MKNAKMSQTLQSFKRFSENDTLKLDRDVFQLILADSLNRVLLKLLLPWKSIISETIVNDRGVSWGREESAVNRQFEEHFGSKEALGRWEAADKVNLD